MESSKAGKSCASSEKRSFWQRLMNPPECSMLRMIAVGVVGGIIIWGALNTGVEYTNRTEFCLSCHEMRIPYEEYKKTVHYSNRTGTTVTCSDCHVASSKHPFDYARKLTMKVLAARDVLGHISGIVDTPEKFDAHRLEMAQRVWKKMKDADSAECRNCHKFETMDKGKQKDRSQVKHEGAIEDGKTCIDCHKGIAHKPVHQLLDGSAKAEPATMAAPTATAPAAAPAAQAPSAPSAPSPAPGKDSAPTAVVKSAAEAGTTAMTAGMKAATQMIGAATQVATAVATAGSTAGSNIDWSKVPIRTIKVFYPGQAALEWVMNKAEHSSATDIIEKKRPCAKCHEGDANEIGATIVAGKPVGAAKAVQEPSPVPGKAGFIPVTFQAVHDDGKIYFHFEWDAPKPVEAKKMDPKNEVKLTMMFDGGGTVEGSMINGCWQTCHTDLRTMKDAKDDKKTKYIEGADLASGKFLDLIQYRSGKGEKPVDGYVAESRQMSGGKGLVAAEGKKEGPRWSVTLVRNLAGGGKGDHAIVPDKTYYFGFAIHEDHANARYHYVSLGYQFGLDKAVTDVKNYINITRQ